MTKYPRSHLDLLKGRHTAVLTTVTRNGYPHNSPVLFLLDDDGRIKISVGRDWSTTHGFRRDDKGNILILDPYNAARYIEIHADLEILPDPDLSFERRVGNKYGIHDIQPSAHDASGRMILVAKPVSISAYGQQSR
jgi:hypothetical protein